MRTCALIAVTLAVVGCSSSSDTGTNTGGAPGGTSIGTAGGTVTSSDGKVQLTIPAGALSRSISFSVAPDTATPGTGSALVPGSVYDFEPTGTTFAVPATLRFAYQPSQLPVGTDPLFLSVYQRDGSTWDSIPSTLDTVAHTVTASVSHFTDYGLCAGPCIVPATGFVRMGFYPGCCSVLPVGGQIVVHGAIEWNNTDVAATVTLGSLPTGVTGSVTVGAQSAGCPSICSAPVTVTLNATGTAAPGRQDVLVNVSAAGGTPVTGFSTIALDVTAVPGFVLSAAPTSLPLTGGGSALTTVTITRTNFTAPVSLGATGLPTGVTAAFAPATLDGDTLSSAVTFSATNAVPGGNSQVVIHGTASGAPDETDTVTLVVAPFSIAAAPPSATVNAGSSISFGVKVTRASGFATPVTLAVTGLPSGVTASFASTSVADSSVLTITAAAGAVVGLYPIEVTGTAGAVTQQAPISLQVAQSGGGLRLDFSACSVRPLWVALQDSTGPWTAISGSNGIYQLPTPASQHVGLARVQPTSGGGFQTVVVYLTSAELSQTASAAQECDVADQTFTGTATGTDSAAGAAGIISMGGGGATVVSDGPFTLSAPPGVHDLTGYLERTDLSLSDSDRVLINRNVSSPGTVNFGAGTAVAVDSATVLGGSAGDYYSVNMFYVSHACEQNELYVVGSPSPTFAITGVPASLQMSSDLHALFVAVENGASTQWVTTMFHSMGNITVTLGAAISPTVTAITTPYKRLSMTLPALPSDYTTASIGAFYGTDNADQVVVTASRNYLGDGSVTLTMPDFSAISGFSTSWEPTASTTLNTYAEAESAPLTVPHSQQCGEGFTVKAASVTGSN